MRRRPSLDILACIAFLLACILWSLIVIHYAFEWWIGR